MLHGTVAPVSANTTHEGVELRSLTWGELPALLREGGSLHPFNRKVDRLQNLSG
jgi:hypothetical protein